MTSLEKATTLRALVKQFDQAANEIVRWHLLFDREYAKGDKANQNIMNNAIVHVAELMEGQSDLQQAIKELVNMPIMKVV